MTSDRLKDVSKREKVKALIEKFNISYMRNNWRVEALKSGGDWWFSIKRQGKEGFSADDIQYYEDGEMYMINMYYSFNPLTDEGIAKMDLFENYLTHELCLYFKRSEDMFIDDEDIYLVVYEI